MKYELELKPFEKRDGLKYKIIKVTDIALHTTECDPSSLGKKIKQSFKNNKPGRIYGQIQGNISPLDDMLSFLEKIKKDPDFIKMVQKEEKKGYKILVALPKTGIPIFPGKDTQEFINSKNGKRIIRGLAKNKDKDI